MAGDDRALDDLARGGLNISGGRVRTGGDLIGGDKHEYHDETIYNTILRGPDELPTRYDGRVQSFMEYYLGTAARPVPFGGRAASLATLDIWLADPGAPPYLLLAAPAGRGKSGLLAHWVARLTKRAAGPHLVYLPISIRFQTNTESVVFASLAARLAHLHGEKVSPLVDAQQYRGLFADYLRRAPPDGGRVLVVIDGLDEAGGWEAGADLFPIAPPPHLRVVAAGRLTAGDLDGTAWLAQLGWEQPGLARRMPLEALDRAGVADVLEQLAAPLGAAAKDPALIDRLHTLSEGDPLLVRLYVSALLPQGDQPAAFKPGDLDHLAPGLKAFLKQWMKEQLSLWGPADPTESVTVQGVLDACAMALGPLRRDDLLALDEKLFPSGRAITRALRPLSRLIIGDAETGYVFSHPRLDEYFVDEMAKDERAAWDKKFLTYGARTLAALADGTLAPAAASPYLLQHYGAHLEQAHAPSAEIFALLALGWLRAHESVLGTPAGFLDDARRVARRAQADGPPALGQQVRAALSFASIAAIGSNIRSDLLEAGVRAGVMSPAAALVLARQKTSLLDRVRCLAVLAPLLPAAQQAAVLEEALQSAELISGWDRPEALDLITRVLPKPAPDHLASRLLDAARHWEMVFMRAVPLAQIAAALPAGEAGPVLTEALARARADPESNARATQLLAVAKAAPASDRLALAREAWLSARTVESDSYRATLLGQAAELLPEAERAAAMTEAFEAINTASMDEPAARIMLELFDRLPPGVREQAQASLAAEFQQGAGQPRRRIKGSEADELHNAQSDWASLLSRYAPFLPEADVHAALAQAWTIDSTAVRLRALIAVAARLPLPERREVMAQAIASARLMDQDEFLWALHNLAEHLPAELVADTAGAVRTLPSRRVQAMSLARLAQRLPPDERLPLMAEALTAARALEDQPPQAAALRALAACLGGAERDRFFTAAWSIVRGIREEAFRLDQYRLLAQPGLPVSIQKEILSDAGRARGAGSVAQVLAALAPILTTNLAPEALALARGLDDAGGRVTALLAIAPRLSGDAAQALYREALTAAKANEYESSRVDALVEVALAAPDALRPEALAEAIAAARSVRHAPQQVAWLAKLAPLAEDEEQRKQVAAAFTAAASIEDEAVRAQAFETLAPILPGDFLDAAQEVAEKIGSDFHRNRVLAVLAAARDPEAARAEALSEQAAQSDPARVAEAEQWLLHTRTLVDSKARVEALGDLLQRLPDSALPDALRTLWTCADRQESLPILRQLVSRWPALVAAGGLSSFDALCGSLSAYGETPRPQFLEALQILAPVLAEVGGEAAVIAAAEAVLEAGKWWE